MTTVESVNGSPGPLPQNLNRLSEVAQNLWWSWTPEARRLFESIDPTVWFHTHHNPVKLFVRREAGTIEPSGRGSVFSPGSIPPFSGYSTIIGRANAPGSAHSILI